MPLPTTTPAPAARAPSVAILFAVLGGLAADAAFPERSWWFLAPVGVALLLAALHGAGAWRAAGYGMVWGVAFFAPHLLWAYEAAGAVPWILLTVAQAAFIALFALLFTVATRWSLIAGRWLPRSIVAALVWVGLEQLRGVAPFGGLPWGQLAFSQTTGPLLRHASVGGAVLVSGIVVLLGAWLVVALAALREMRIARASTAVVLAGLAIGSGLLIPIDTSAELGKLRVAAVQGNVPAPGLEAFAERRDVVERHAEGTKDLLDQVEPGDVDVVLWPENSADIDPRTDPATAELIDEAAEAIEAPILVGTQAYVEDHRYNDAVMWEPGDGAGATYTKQHPAPFGEYIPLRDLARMVTPAVDLVSVDMLPGHEPGIIGQEIQRLGREVGLGIGICFEVAYSGIVQDSVAEGSEIIVIPTNNASFGYTQESNQQLAMSVFRAVEHARATIHVSTVGTSAIIAPNGVVLEKGGHFTAEQLVHTVPLRSSLTIATRLGAWPAIVASALAGGALLGGLITTVTHRRKGSSTA